MKLFTGKVFIEATKKYFNILQQSDRKEFETTINLQI